MSTTSQQCTDHKWTLAIHGGAGTIIRKPGAEGLAQEAAYRAELQKALQAGANVLRTGGSSTDAVVAAVRVMEDSPLFNAGKGAVYNHDEQHELDAAVMEGSLRRAGAVSAVRTIKNPIEGARIVMERSGHVLMTSEGAEKFAAEQGVEIVPNAYFNTEYRHMQWQVMQQKEAAISGSTAAPLVSLDHADSRLSTPAPVTSSMDLLNAPSPASWSVSSLSPCTSPSIASSTCPSPSPTPTPSLPSTPMPLEPHPLEQQLIHPVPDRATNPADKVAHKFGTVGAVARDMYGNVAAATSTGGMTNKLAGRVGDSPLIGAGTYADNLTAAVSCTGYGEYFIRSSAARDVCSAMEYKQCPVQEAAEYVVRKFNTFHRARPGGCTKGLDTAALSPQLAEEESLIEFRGGLIAVDRDGNYSLPFNSTGMYRGVVNEAEDFKVFIWKEEEFDV